METIGKKPRRRRSFTPEFKAEIVDLCQRGDRSVGRVAKDFDLTETAVREWVKQPGRDAGARADGGLTTGERKELNELRRENRLPREDEILKRAALTRRLNGERCAPPYPRLRLQPAAIDGMELADDPVEGCYFADRMTGKQFRLADLN
jgi:transposase